MVLDRCPTRICSFMIRLRGLGLLCYLIADLESKLMPKTWSSEDVSTETCGNCGAVYQVKLRRVPMREKDYFDCQMCGTRMNEWNDTEYPVFTLIEPKEPA